MVSLLNGRAFAPIHIVCVEDCLKFGHKVLKSLSNPGTPGEVDRLKVKDSVDMFEKCLRRGEDLILEGGNRIKTIQLFLQDEIEIPSGTVIKNHKNGNWIIKTEKPMTYSQLVEDHPQAPRSEAHLDNANLINTIYHTRSHWFELEDDFININDGLPLVPMEKLWVQTSPVSKVIRPLVEFYSEDLEDRYGKNKYINTSRRGDARMITAAALVLSDGFGVDTKMKDISSFWNSSSPMSKDLCKKVKLFVHNLLYCDFDDYYTETTGKNDPPKWMTTGMFYTLLDLSLIHI